MSESRVLRCGVVGARRSRQGTGPFLAQFLEDAGAEVVGVVGRGVESARAAAVELRARLGHEVAAHGSLGELLPGIDALVIASPDGAHLDALRAAAAARVAVLCEKPLVPAEDHAAVAPLLSAFRAHDTPLMEGCQWPETLESFDALHPGRAARPSQFAMRLSPAEPGESMLRSSLSHLLSVVQAALPVEGSAAVEDLRFTGRCGVRDGLVTEFRLAGAACRLELVVCPDQPRPAWFEIDGRRVVREVDLTDYSMRFTFGDRSISTGDPTRALVYRFADLVRSASRERTRTETNRVEHRARFYHRIVGGFLRHLA